MRPCSWIRTTWRGLAEPWSPLCPMRVSETVFGSVDTNAPDSLPGGGRQRHQCPLPRALHMTPIGMMPPKKILIIKLRHIGDVLLSTPVLRALRDAFPDAQLTMLVNRGTEGVLAHHPDVNEVLCLEKAHGLTNANSCMAFVSGDSIA